MKNFNKNRTEIRKTETLKHTPKPINSQLSSIKRNSLEYSRYAII